MGKENIKIGMVKGDVVISKNQSGGTTAQNVNATSPHKKMFWKIFWTTVGGLASIVTIFAYLDFYPFNKKQDKQPVQNVITKITPPVEQKKIESKKISKKMNMNDKNETPIKIGNVAGDVIISQNQTGGITAHTVYINKPLPREINDEDKKALGVLNKEYLISITVIMGNESQNYANQIVQFLQSKGYKIEMNYIGMLMPEPEPARYHLNTNNISKTIELTIPKTGG